MADRLLLTVRGRSGASYSFVFTGDRAHLDELRADGLDVAEVANVVPVWAAQLGLAHAWCRAQDVWRLLWL